MKDKIIEILQDMTDEELFEICRECNGWDGSLDWLCYEEFDDDFFDTYFEGRPAEAARAVHFGDVNWSDRYIRFNAYGNLETVPFLSSIGFSDYLGDIAETIERLYGKIYVPAEIDELFEAAEQEAQQ